MSEIAARLPGPRDLHRAAPAETLLPKARDAARAAGVTRIAELTRLDRIGLPVWQAVRPFSRALSVHQGKGGSDAEAQLGALLEAVESHWAEQLDVPGPCCRFGDLPIRERPATLADFAAHRGRPPPEDEAHRWVETRDLLTGARLHLPFAVASLDFTRDAPSRFDRASNGVATGTTADEALTAALHEIIERDGVTEWRGSGLIARTATRLRPRTIPFDWYGFWADRLRRAGVALHSYAIPSITGSPVFVCELRDDGNATFVYRSLSGWGCHFDPELALFKALTEAIQGRATYIAGAREDIAPFYDAAPANVVRAPYGLPPTESMPGVDFADIAPGSRSPGAIGCALASAGFARIAVLPIAQLDGLTIVRAFVYGLGSMTRRRGGPR